MITSWKSKQSKVSNSSWKALKIGAVPSAWRKWFYWAIVSEDISQPATPWSPLTLEKLRLYIDNVLCFQDDRCQYSRFIIERRLESSVHSHKSTFGHNHRNETTSIGNLIRSSEWKRQPLQSWEDVLLFNRCPRNCVTSRQTTGHHWPHLSKHCMTFESH